MKLSKNAAQGKSLSKKITVRILAVLFVIFALFMAIRMVATKNDLEVRELEKLSMLANENAAIAKNLMEAMVYKQEVLSSAIGTMSGDDTQKLANIEHLLAKTKAEESKILSLFFVAEPNAFVANSPKGLSVFSTGKSTSVTHDRFSNINEALYNKIKTSTTIVIVDPFNKTIDGKEYKVISVLQPIFNQSNQYIGMIGSNIDVTVLNAASYNNGGFESFSNQIICGHQTFMVHTTNPDAIGKSFSETTVSTNSEKILDSAKNAAPLTFLDTNVNGTREYRAFVPFYVASSKVVWLSGTSIRAEEFNTTILSQVVQLFVTMTIGLILMALFFFFIIRKELLPIKELEHAAKEMSKGNLNIQISHRSNDELGSLAESFRCSGSTILSYVTEIDRTMEAMSRGNFSQAVSQPFIGDFKHIQDSIARLTAGMSQTLSQIDETSNTVSASAQQVFVSAQTLSHGSVEQASSVEELSGIIAEMTESNRKNAKSASVANEKVATVGEEIEKGDRNMKELAAAMDEISQASKEISKVVKVIEDIAFQTNILALNASVEAARAGAAGKGFAVVAAEVRSLAGKSGSAVKVTTDLIENSIQAVESGRKIAEKTALTLKAVTTDSKDAVLLIDEISKATQAQSLSMEGVSAEISRISGVVQNNSATSEESAAASDELSGQAQLLKSLLSRFKLKGTSTATALK